ncbi:MAG: hypothetical protein KIT37_05500 [Steroidobacteraceae bacterium]|nr:hypothetical protein [Steroidobacteraceae bacterium]
MADETKAGFGIDTMSDEARAHLLQAFRKILRPLVKILIRAGVRLDEFTETVKGVYVESSVRDGMGPFGEATRARIALVTGVPRRDVDRYIDDPSLLAAPRATFARVLTEIIHLWHTDPTFQGPYGIPLELDFDRSHDHSFVALAKKVDPDSDPEALVNELLRARVVLGAKEKSLKVVSRTYVVPVAMSAPMLEHFGNALSDLANTITHNNEAEPSQKRLERSVFPDRGLPVSMMASYEKTLRALVQQMITDLDNWVADNMKGYRPGRGEERIETGITMFQYVRTKKTPPPLHVLLPPGPTSTD